jgi:hypothetical protein
VFLENFPDFIALKTSSLGAPAKDFKLEKTKRKIKIDLNIGKAPD